MKEEKRREEDEEWTERREAETEKGKEGSR